MKRNLIVVLVLLIVFFSNTSNAAQIKISFEGTINRVEAGTYSVGQMVSGFLTYDSETALTWSSAGSPPYTTNFNGAIDYFLLDNQQVDYVTFNILAQNRYSNPVDYSMRFSVAGYDEISGLYENLDLDFRGTSLLDSIYLILEKPNLANMSSATFGYTKQKVGLSDGFLQERFYGDVTSLEVTCVPIPSAVWLLGSGLLGLCGLRQKKRRDYRE